MITAEELPKLPFEEVSMRTGIYFCQVEKNEA